MNANENITHPGIIDDVTQEMVYVKILAMSACSSCHSKGMCSVAEMEEKVVEVKADPQRTYAKGEQVTVTMKKSLGSKAVLLGYIAPFLIMIGVLMLILSLTNNEGLAGLLGIATLVPYYWLLFIYRNRLKKTFSFTLE